MSGSCPHSGAVLARHLDGDVSAADRNALSPQELADHLRRCPRCQRELELSRILDAAVATSSRSPCLREDGDELLAGALARIHAPDPLPSSSSHRHPISLWTGASLLAAGFLCAWLMFGGGSGSAPAPGDTPGLQPVPAPGPAGDGLLMLSAAASLPGNAGARDSAPVLSGPPRTSRAIERLVDFASPRGTAAAAALLRATAPLTWRMDELEVGLRRHAGRLLLASGHPDALEGWLTLWQRAPAAEQNGLTRDLRSHRRAVRSLRQQIRRGDPAVLAANAAVGDQTTDDRLRSYLRRHPEQVGAVADSLAQAGERPSRTRFLLDLFLDLMARRTQAELPETAELLFAGQPAPVTTELVAVARKNRNGDRRRHALLALAMRRDPQALAGLRAVATGIRRGDALLAGFALSRLDAAPLEDLAPLAYRTDPTGALVRAALASARSPQVDPWIDTMDLTSEERAFLHAGAFTYQQYPIAVELFRLRTLAGH